MNLQCIWDALKTVIDPEVHIDIVAMGLIYNVAEDGGRVSITMTLTTPACPLSNQLTKSAREAVEAVPGVESVELDLVWDPRWSPAMMADDARKKLGW